MHTRLNYVHPSAPPSLILSVDAERQLASLQTSQVCSSFAQHSHTTIPQQRSTFPLQAAIHIHAFYIDLLHRIFSILIESGLYGADILITTDTPAKQRAILSLLDLYDSRFAKPTGLRSVILYPNRGRNVLPLAQSVCTSLQAYSHVLHLHTKKSLGGVDFAPAWHEDMLIKLCGSPNQRHVVDAFFAHPSAGLLLPTRYSKVDHFYNWGANYDLANELFCYLLSHHHPNNQIETEVPSRIDFQSLLVFPAGMMFWFRPIVLLPLMRHLSDASLYPEEPMNHDGTIAHAAERILCHACELKGYRWMLLDDLNSPPLSDQHAQTPISGTWSVLRAYPEDYSYAVAAAFRDLFWRHTTQELSKVSTEYSPWGLISRLLSRINRFCRRLLQR